MTPEAARGGKASETANAVDVGRIKRHGRDPFVAAERGFVDDVIMPMSTRRRVARAFAALRGKQQSMPWKKNDNLPL